VYAFRIKAPTIIFFWFFFFYKGRVCASDAVCGGKYTAEAEPVCGGKIYSGSRIKTE